MKGPSKGGDALTALLGRHPEVSFQSGKPRAAKPTAAGAPATFGAALEDAVRAPAAPLSARSVEPAPTGAVNVELGPQAVALSPPSKGVARREAHNVEQARALPPEPLIHREPPAATTPPVRRKTEREVPPPVWGAPPPTGFPAKPSPMSHGGSQRPASSDPAVRLERPAPPGREEGLPVPLRASGSSSAPVSPPTALPPKSALAVEPPPRPQQNPKTPAVKTEAEGSSPREVAPDRPARRAERPKPGEERSEREPPSPTRQPELLSAASTPAAPQPTTATPPPVVQAPPEVRDAVLQALEQLVPHGVGHVFIRPGAAEVALPFAADAALAVRVNVEQGAVQLSFSGPEHVLRGIQEADVRLALAAQGLFLRGWEVVATPSSRGSEWKERSSERASEGSAGEAPPDASEPAPLDGAAANAQA